MIQGLYAAATGLDARSLQQDVISENLAHATVPGYRQRGVAFQTFDAQLSGLQRPAPPPPPPPAANEPPPNVKPVLQGTQLTQLFDNFTPGPLEYTGNPLDVAASGNTFFVLDGPSGPLFTRNGSFTINQQGELVNQNGLRVRSEGGAITFPAEAGRIAISDEGVITSNGQEIGRLQLENVPDPRVLQRVGTTLFTGFTSQGRPDPGAVQVIQGYREGSNVQPVQEMVNLIAVQRYYDAAQRALRALSDAVALNTRPQV
jgi:flagellar basal-body rod protein FlgF